MTSLHSLFTQLNRTLGRRAAAQEFRWMRDRALALAHAHSSHAYASLERMVLRRLAGEPLQYILGSQPFGPLDLRVRPPVLIPRPETEDWSFRLARLLTTSTPHPQAPLNILDLCTGTACIPLLLSHLSPAGSIRALAIDIASDAIHLANENAVHVGVRISRPAYSHARSELNTISFLQSDILHDGFRRLLKALGWPSFDVLTANPPYIPLHEYNALPSSVKDYEDPRALIGDPEGKGSDGRGLVFYRAIATLLRDGLVKRDGLVALEVGHDQSAEVQRIMHEDGQVQRTEVWKDLWGVERTVVCRR